MFATLLLFPLLLQVAAPARPAFGVQPPAATESAMAAPQSPVGQSLPAGPAPSDHELVIELLDRVRQLEVEIATLKAQHTATANFPAAPGTTAAPPPPAQAVTAPASRAQQPAMPEMMPAGPADTPVMSFRGFSDVSYLASGRPGDHQSFAVGQFNLFITSRLSDRLTVIAEPVLEADEQNHFGFELERLLLQLTANPYFAVSVGRYHTAIGWYNTAYHHSTWLQTAIGRPFQFAFEDQGGILPVHNVGVSASGQIPSGSFHLRYVAEVGNGRASRSPLDEPVQNVRDENNRKAVNVAVFARPERLPGFQTGVSVYRDRLQPVGLEEFDQTILAAHAVYQHAGLEWLNEVVTIGNSGRSSGRVFRTTGFYTQFSRAFGPVRPYARYEYVNAPNDDVLFPDIGLLRGPSVGIRYDFSLFSALKFQYQRTNHRGEPGYNGVATQLSFTF